MTIPIGGQAVIEGVMFKSQHKISTAVRDPNGKIIVVSERFKSISEKYKILGLPLIRGVVNLVEMLQVGFKTLNYSAQVAGDEGEISKKETFFTTAFAILVTIGLFVVLPLFLTKKLITSQGLLFNFIDGLIRIGIFTVYLLIINFMPDIRRVFQYHGAEHATINCYEDLKDWELVTPKKAVKYTTIHPRCGTSFLFLVMIVSIIVFSIVQTEGFIAKVLSRVLLLPLIAGISYEVLKFSAKHEKNILIKILISPGLLFQKITTKKPTIKQVEVAIAAFRKHF
ncbi:DUF1385 domain-containing protein [Candidatus Woesearchaeota archaeon]|nr:DUF1385 domain-containing protein [Candidatus Woesearchaeota archaeon]